MLSANFGAYHYMFSKDLFEVTTGISRFRFSVPLSRPFSALEEKLSFKRVKGLIKCELQQAVKYDKVSQGV